MSRRSHFTHITPLPAGVSREAAILWLHNHREMIELNPLVIRHSKCAPHETAPKEEHACIWYEMTDSISYLPGRKSEVKYKGAFHNLPNGLQTHVYAPAGLDLREKWVICGNMPGEPRSPVEMGVEAPRDGLYIREDVDMRCNFLLAGFVKKNLNKAHKVMVDRIVEKASTNQPNVNPDGDDPRPSATIHHSGAGPSAAELPADEAAQARKELAACQCPDSHLPTCPMYVDPAHGQFTPSDRLHKVFPRRRQSERIPYEQFRHVRVTSLPGDSPELFSGNFHPVSHYHLLFGNSDEVAGAPPVSHGKLSRIRAELPATPT